MWILIILAVLFIILLVTNVRVVPQATEFVIERLGTYYTTWETGLHFKVPLVDRVAKRISLKEQVMDFAPQPVITKDNVTMQIDTIVFYQVTDAKLYTYGVERPILAIESLTATTLRNIIGDMELDHTLTSRDVINSRITSALDQATDKWGIKVNRVELKNIVPPRDIQDAMEKQMRAERERREAILRAEGEKRSQILIAEGKKESQILNAEAEKQAAILLAEAEKEKKIREGQGDFIQRWNDPLLGDPAFYAAVVAPLVERLDKAGAELTAPCADAEVERFFTEFAPLWAEIGYELAERRTQYLNDRLFAEEDR